MPLPGSAGCLAMTKYTSLTPGGGWWHGGAPGVDMERGSAQGSDTCVRVLLAWRAACCAAHAAVPAKPCGAAEPCPHLRR